MKGCGSTLGNNAFQVGGDDVTVENVVGKDCSKGISISGSGTWVGNSTFSNNHYSGAEIWVGDSSTTAVTFYSNNVWWNGNHGVRVLEDDAIIKNNNIRNNTLDGVHCAGGSDLFIENNTIVDNGDDGIELVTNVLVS